MLKIYTTPTCGICKIIKKKLMDKNIPFEQLDLIDYAEQLNIYTSPVLELENNILLTSPTEINDWINNYQE